jgi:hypothetical protein
MYLLLVLSGLVTTSGSGSVLSLNTAGAATTVGRSGSKVNVLLGVKTDGERRNVDNLLTNTDVSLLDENTGVVNRLGKTKLEDLGLESSLQEVLNTESKNVIELHLVLGKNTNADETSNQGVTLEKTLGILLITGQKITSSTSDLRELKTDSVDFSLVSQTVLTGKLELSVETGKIVSLSGDSVSLRVRSRSAYKIIISN